MLLYNKHRKKSETDILKKFKNPFKDQVILFISTILSPSRTDVSVTLKSTNKNQKGNNTHWTQFFQKCTFPYVQHQEYAEMRYV